MTKTTTVASKAFVAIVAAAMVFSLVAPAAKAATAEELQAQIAALMAQITALQGGNTTTTTTTTTSTCAAIPAPLTMNSTGVNVTALQNFLISKGQSIPAGATGFFGAQTRSALAAYQTANGIMPAVGYYGPVTAAKMAAMCVPVTPGTGTGTTPTTPGGSTTLKGEASLDSFELDDADDTDVAEGDEEVEIGMITVNFTDGDAEISRLDIALTDSEGTDSDAWDTFESVQLMVDGKMIAEVDASSKDDYLGDEDFGVLRFADLKLVGEEDEDLEITVTATLQDNLDAENLGEWDLKGDAIRFFDADGVATTEDGTTVTSETATFKIETAGENEELKFSLASGNPDATDIIVDESGSTKNVTILEYKIKAEDNDITLNNLYVKLTTSDLIGDVLSDVMIDVDGEVFDAEATLVAGALNSTTATYNFDIDGDVVIDADDEVIVKVMVDFKRQDTNYPNGTTIKAEVTSVEVDLTKAEGADDLDNSSPDQLTGSAIGKLHTVISSGLKLDASSTKVTPQLNSTTPANSFAEYVIVFDVTAVEDTAFVPLTAGRGASVATSATSTEFVIENSSGAIVTTGATDAQLTRKSGGTVSGNVVEIADGDTATFELLVTYNPGVGDAAGLYRLQLINVGFSATSVGTATIAVVNRSMAIPVEDFETSSTNITN